VTPRPVDALLRRHVRPRVQRAVRSRVAGEDYLERADRIWNTVGPRWFGPADPIWWVHASPAMFVGGIRALLVQSLHPLAMAGVAGHSGFKGDPWGRLQRTSSYIATTTYATVPDAERAIATVRAIHRRVRGTASDGRPYAADDPHLLAWVHAAEAESFLLSFQELSGHPLTRAQADVYVAQIGTVSARLGVLDPPTSVAGLRATLAAYRPELDATPAALEAADFLLHHPPLPIPARAPYAALAAGALALTPPWARDMLGLSAGPVSARLRLGAGRGATSLIGWAMDHPSTQGQWDRPEEPERARVRG
jgi:uncharacterized protein (DUF2236 family)